MVYREFREWLANHFAGCADHGTTQPEYVLRVLDQMIEKSEAPSTPAAAPAAPES